MGVPWIEIASSLQSRVGMATKELFRRLVQVLKTEEISLLLGELNTIFAVFNLRDLDLHRNFPFSFLRLFCDGDLMSRLGELSLGSNFLSEFECKGVKIGDPACGEELRSDVTLFILSHFQFVEVNLIVSSSMGSLRLIKDVVISFW